MNVTSRRSIVSGRRGVAACSTQARRSSSTHGPTMRPSSLRIAPAASISCVIRNMAVGYGPAKAIDVPVVPGAVVRDVATQTRALRAKHSRVRAGTLRDIGVQEDLARSSGRALRHFVACPQAELLHAASQRVRVEPEDARGAIRTFDYAVRVCE